MARHQYRGIKHASKFAPRTAPRAMQKKARSDKYAAARLKLSKPMRVLVDRRVDRKLETKVGYRHVTFNPSSKITYSQVSLLLPEIPQAGSSGNPEVDREVCIGSSIIATSFHINGYMNMVYEDSEPDWSTILARMFIVSDKGIRFYGALSGGVYDFVGELLRHGSTPQDYDGTPEAQLMPINFDRVTTHHTRTYNLAGDMAVHTGFTGSLKVKTIPFRVNLKLKNKVLKYAEPDDVFPHNYAPVFALGWTCANGNTPSGSPVKVVYTTTLRYKDA